MTIHVPAQYPRSFPAKVAFVGEAPSDEELERGAPLVGPSGRIFNAMLRTAGLDREEYLITNVFDEKLPDNNVRNWCMSMQEAREAKMTDLPPIGSAGFLRPEYRWHLDRLKKEILDVQPSVIVPLGATALWAFTGQDGISATRGAVLAATRLIPGAKLLPTFHPAHVMHQWKFFPVVVGDFTKAVAEAERGRSIILPRRELLIEPTMEDLHEWKPKLLASNLLSVDIETGWGQITCIGFAPSSEEAICIPFVDKRVASRSYWPTVAEEVSALGIVKEVLESNTPKLGQNFGGYDFYWLLEKYGMKVRNMRHDTRLLHHALYAELPKDLEFLAASYSTQGVWKAWGKKQEKRDD